MIFRIVILIAFCSFTYFVYIQNRNTSKWKPEDPIFGVKEITEDEYLSLYEGKERGIIFFYGKHCVFSGPVVPFVEAIAKEINSQALKIGFWKMDADKLSASSRLFGVYGTPSIVLITKFESDPDYEVYSGERTIPSFMSFLKKNLLVDIHDEKNVKEFDSDLFHSNIGKSNNVLIYFDSPLDDSARMILPILDAVGQEFRNEDRLIVARCLHTKETSDIHEEYANEYPSLMFFPAHSTIPVPLRGELSVSQISDFVRAKKTSSEFHDEL